MMSQYQKTLLIGWEEVTKKSQLSLWIMLSLKDGSKNTAEIKSFIEKMTDNIITADNQSMYRALRRFTKSDIVSYEMSKTSHGPETKIYSLNKTGSELLTAYIERNITNIFTKPAIQKLIGSKLEFHN